MSLKNITIILIFISVLILNPSCKPEEKDGPTIFNDVTLISATLSGNNIVLYEDVPDEAVELVVGIFSGTEINVNADNVITNTDWLGGNRTGLNDGMDRGGSTKYFSYNLTDKDFNETDDITATIASSSGVWAVWGYNSQGVVICSSDKNDW